MQEGQGGPRVQGTEDQLRSCPSSQSPGWPREGVPQRSGGVTAYWGDQEEEVGAWT